MPFAWLYVYMYEWIYVCFQIILVLIYEVQYCLNDFYYNYGLNFCWVDVSKLLIINDNWWVLIFPVSIVVCVNLSKLKSFDKVC